MKKRKSSVKKKCASDRLSELPDSLIFNIFELLPMSDVVRTTILSKRWENLWTTIPWLDFNDPNKMSTDRYRNLVDGAINSWRGIKIVRFSLGFDYEPEAEKSLTSDHIDSWMRFAMEKKVEDLKLDFDYNFKVYDENWYLVPPNLYLCSWLKRLCLLCCELQIRGNVEWDQLTSLKLHVEGLSENAINQVLCGSPRLEYFRLTLYEMNENLTIRSNSLRTLFVAKYLYYENDAPSMETELRIWAPGLRTLDFEGVPYGKCLLMDVSSLTTALLDFDCPEHYTHHAFYENGFLGEPLCQILPQIKHASSVTLSNWCIKALGAMQEKRILSPLPTVTFLRLKVCSEEYEQVVGVVKMFPKLRTLLLKTTYKSSPPKHVESSLKFDSYLSLLYLRKIDVTWTNGDNSIFPLIQILLEYARTLEKMVFTRDKGNKPRTSWKSLFTASQKLLKMKRSSTAELISASI